MSWLEGMHAPGSQTAHLLPPAGVRTSVDEVYRFHRVIPYYPPDPCIRPNEADLVCPPENLSTKNNATMPAAGVSTANVSDVFSFHKAREGRSKKPCFSGGKQAVERPCPCSNSFGNQVVTPAGNFDLRYKGISTPKYNQQQNDDNKFIDCQNTLDSQYSYSSCWPLPRQGGVSSEVKEQGNNGSNHLKPHSSQAVEGHRNPTPNSALQMPFIQGSMGVQHQTPVYTNCTPQYICQPVFDRKYLQDCPQQDGPPADSYTFL